MGFSGKRGWGDSYANRHEQQCEPSFRYSHAKAGTEESNVTGNWARAHAVRFRPDSR